MNFIFLALKYLPFVLKAVLAVEETMKGQPGATKKAIVLETVQAAAKAAGESADEHVKAVGDTVDTVVKTLNTFGWAK